MAIELSKKGQVVNLEKKSNNQLGEILVNLNWNQQPKEQKGFLNKLFSVNKSVDLDLGCLFELKSGQKGVVQALGNAFGSLQGPPYISLDGDDRTGANAAGENLRINGNMVKELKRILVYSFIYEGAPAWSQVDGVVTIKQPSGQDIIVRMDEHSNNKMMCAIALIENVNDETFSIQRLVQYFSGHVDMDNAYNWGLRWVAGSK